MLMGKCRILQDLQSHEPVSTDSRVVYIETIFSTRLRSETLLHRSKEFMLSEHVDKIPCDFLIFENYFTVTGAIDDVWMSIIIGLQIWAASMIDLLACYHAQARCYIIR